MEQKNIWKFTTEKFPDMKEDINLPIQEAQ